MQDNPITPSQIAPLELQYARPEQRSRRREIVWLALTAPAAAVPFLSITFDVSPLRAVSAIPSSDSFLHNYAIFTCGASFFVIFPLLAWQLRRMLAGEPGRIETFLARGVAFLCNLPAAILILLLAQDADHEWQLIATLIGAIALIMMGSFTAWRQRNPVEKVEPSLIAPYLANALIMFVAFWREGQIGYWMTTAVALVLLARLVSRCVSPILPS